MLGPERARELANQALGSTRADQVEVILLANESALTRYANNSIHQNVTETDISMRIRVVLGKRMGVATVNDLAADSLKRAAETARAIAQLQPENPDFKGLPGPREARRVNVYSDHTAQMTPEARARVVGGICKQARGARLTAAGAFSTAAYEVAVANSLGTFAYHPYTVADLHTVMMGESGSGYASAVATDVRQIDAESVMREALGKAQRARDPQPVEPGSYTVLLEEYAVNDIINFLSALSFHALVVQENRSFMKAGLGQRVMSEGVTLWDDGGSPETIALPFDYEGVPREKVTFVERGIARGITYDSYTAGREGGGAQSTGHAWPSPNSFGPAPLHRFMEAGTASKEELVRSIERGILVTRFWYTRVVHPLKVVITGMTRDGTFLIEKGEITRPVRNLRFTTSYLEALNQVRGVGRERKLQQNAWGNAASLVPALVVDGFNFTGVTQF